MCQNITLCILFLSIFMNMYLSVHEIIIMLFINWYDPYALQCCLWQWKCHDCFCVWSIFIIIFIIHCLCLSVKMYWKTSIYTTWTIIFGYYIIFFVYFELFVKQAIELNISTTVCLKTFVGVLTMLIFLYNFLTTFPPKEKLKKRQKKSLL